MQLSELDSCGNVQGTQKEEALASGEWLVHKVFKAFFEAAGYRLITLIDEQADSLQVQIECE